jgi:hypothetical protein
MSLPYLSCPSYGVCAVNACPLDPGSATHGGRRVNLPGDPEHECRASRTTRETIAAQHGRPPSWGWLARERANDSRARAQRASWAATPSGARARRRAGLRTAPGTSIVPRDYGVPAPLPVGLGAR